MSTHKSTGGTPKIIKTIRYIVGFLERLFDIGPPKTISAVKKSKRAYQKLVGLYETYYGPAPFLIKATAVALTIMGGMVLIIPFLLWLLAKSI